MSGALTRESAMPGESKITSAQAQQAQVSTTKSWMALGLAVLEAACVFAVAAAKTGVLLGSIAAAAAGWTVALHRDALRIPALLIAIVGSMINIYLVWKFFRLRNAPEAAWRKRPLTAGNVLRISIVLGLSAITLLLAFSEIYLHRQSHHSLL
jgi:hypothetical protein